MKKAETVLGPMLKRLGIESGVRLERIRNDWFDIFETSLSSHMYPAGCTRDELLLNVDSPAWMQQLTYYKKDVIGKLSAYGITGVRFRVGKVRGRGKPAEKRDIVRVPSEDDLSFAESAVSDITDARIRESIRRAIEKSLSSRRKS